MRDIPQKDSSISEKLNDDEFTEFDEKMNGTIDQPFGIKLISVASNTNLCIW